MKVDECKNVYKSDKSKVVELTKQLHFIIEVGCYVSLIYKCHGFAVVVVRLDSAMLTIIAFRK